MMSNILTRSLSGAVYVGLIICTILFGGGFWFPALCCLFAVLATVEFHALGDSRHRVWPGVLLLDIIGVLIISGAPMLLNVKGFGATLSVMMPFFCFIVYFLARMIYQLYLSADSDSLRTLLVSLGGQVYIGFPLACASALYMIGGEAIALTMFIMIWLNDTGAYIVGCSIGKHRLFPRISPKKSWEGFWGGVVFTVGCALVLRYCFESWSPAFPVLAFCGYGAAVSVFATWGDLAESLIKRAVGVKDSGSIMPGHGGILDRIDSLLFVAPMTLVYLMIVTICINQ